ncbi:2-dehydropantoate 2-reductase-like protein [Lojkania enalia]|uniref:2-dehydropantoate 2-reductase n=1 Tax=Lojkania enalia TaxID=147567 RepID=A0A9P4N3V4_9PLEO|nr:2-dehydropantoate 2-reductase-like protein [Didymosphaeria enalia]
MYQSPIHVIGIGSLGKLFAHSLRKCHPELPITLLFHRQSLVDDWDKAGRCIEVVRDGKSDRQSGFNYEYVQQGRGEIRNLICATKTYGTVDAIRPLKERLGPSSTVLFVQNGIGTIDEVTSQVFSQPSSRPNFLAGIVNHGVYATSPFSCVFASPYNVVIGSVSSSTSESPKSKVANTNPLALWLSDCPNLSTELVSPEKLLHIQLMKLSVNAVINPLSAIFDVLNGEVFRRTPIRAIVRPLIAEISAVIEAMLRLKCLHADSIVAGTFAPKNLENYVSEVGAKAAKNSSSMRQDMRAGRRTEIDYINAYIVKQGRNFGIECPLNETLVRLVKEKRLVTDSQVSGVFGI